MSMWAAPASPDHFVLILWVFNGLCPRWLCSETDTSLALWPSLPGWAFWEGRTENGAVWSLFVLWKAALEWVGESYALCKCSCWIRKMCLIIWVKGRENLFVSWMISRGWTWGRGELSQAELWNRRFGVAARTLTQECSKIKLWPVLLCYQTSPLPWRMWRVFGAQFSNGMLSFSAWEGANDFPVQEQIFASLLAWTHLPSAQELLKILLQNQLYFISAVGVLGILHCFFFFLSLFLHFTVSTFYNFCPNKPIWFNNY